MTTNDAKIVEQLSASFAAHFGEGDHAFSNKVSPVGASEDFSILASSVDKPYCEYSSL